MSHLLIFLEYGWLDDWTLGEYTNSGIPNKAFYIIASS